MLNFSKKRQEDGGENDGEGSRQRSNGENKRDGAGVFGRPLKCGIIATKDVYVKKMNEMNFSFSLSLVLILNSSRHRSQGDALKLNTRDDGNHLFSSTTTARTLIFPVWVSKSSPLKKKKKKLNGKRFSFVLLSGFVHQFFFFQVFRAHLLNFVPLSSSRASSKNDVLLGFSV